MTHEQEWASLPMLRPGHLGLLRQLQVGRAAGARPRPSLVVDEHGILGPAAKDREKVVPTSPAPPASDSAGADKAGTGESRDVDVSRIPRLGRLPWAVLLKRVFITDALR